LRLAVAQIFGQLVDMLLSGDIAVHRSCYENDRHKKQNPFARIRLLFDWYLFAVVGHRSSVMNR
jgi:hypothetical protein